MYQRLSDSDKLDIVNQFNNGIPTNQIARYYNRSTTQINGFLRRRKLLAPAKKYILDHDIFEIIDTSEKAYFLGLLYADGCIYKNTLHLSLQELDSDILYKFHDFLKSNHKINKRFDIRQPNSPALLTVSISSKKIINDLKKLGCVERKTFILKFPNKNQVPEKFHVDFIRGYNDGDGSFTRYFDKKGNSYKYCATIVSTEKFCNKLSKIIKEKCNINTYIAKRHKEKDTTTRQLKISGRRQVFSFLEWIYKDNVVCMKRKLDKFIEIKKNFHEIG